MPLLDFASNGQGLLGPGMQNFGTGLLSYFQQNPATIAALAAGIGSAPSMRQGLAAAAGGIPQAMQADQTRQQQTGLAKYFSDPETAKSLGISPGMSQLLSKYPALAEKYAANAFTSQNSTAYSDYLRAKGEGFSGKFTDYQEKYGTNRAAEDWSLTPQLMTDKTGNIVGAMRFSNRGGIQWLDAQGNVTHTFRPGEPGYAAASQTAQASSAASPPAQGAAPAAADAPAAPAGGLRGPGSVKIIDQGTQSTIVSPTGVPQATVPTFNTQKSADTAAGGDQATDLKTVNNNSIKATTQKNSIALMRQASQDKNFYSGFAADPVLAAKKMAIALGADPALAASMENFQSMSNQLVKDRLGSLGTGVSNADVSFISRTVPTLEATPQGNQQLLDILDKLADRDIEVAKVAQQYAKDHGGGTRLDANWSTYLADWAQSHPLFQGAGVAGGGAAKPDPLGIR